MRDPPQSYRRTTTGFEPVSDTAIRFWRETPLGDIVQLDGKRPRNLRHHNYYWAMLGIVVQNSEVFETKRQLHLAIKAALGYGKWVQLPKSTRPLFIEESTSFASMSDAEFAEFLDAAARAITRYWLAGVTVEELMEETRREAGQWEGGAA